MNTATIAEPKQISLYYREGLSDKEYHLRIEPKDDGFVVTFSYGRRGSTLNTGSKTSVPIEYEAAVLVFEKLVREKKAKGYTEGEAGTPYLHSEKTTSGLLPQLLNPIDEAEVSRLIEDDGWYMQEKKDGRRMLIRKAGDQIQGVNRKGLIVGLPENIIRAAQVIPGNFIMDGECMGEILHVFDILETKGQNLRLNPYRHRFLALFNLLAAAQQRFIQLVPVYYDAQEKLARLKEFKAAKAEGVVFKRIDASYVPGRPNAGGSQLKYKFVSTLSAVVAQINAKRSVQLRLLNDEGWQVVGNVTIPANQKVPAVGVVVEIRYLYAFPGGSLFQPVYLGERNDVLQQECVTSQLKLKAEGEEES